MRIYLKYLILLIFAPVAGVLISLIVHELLCAFGFCRFSSNFWPGFGPISFAEIEEKFVFLLRPLFLTSAIVLFPIFAISNQRLLARRSNIIVFALKYGLMGCALQAAATVCSGSVSGFSPRILIFASPFLVFASLPLMFVLSFYHLARNNYSRIHS